MFIIVNLIDLSPNPVVLVLYGGEIIFAGCPRQLIMLYEMILACDVDLKDDEVWKVVYDPELCSFRS